MITLVDFSQMFISSATANADEIKGINSKNFVKTIVLNQLLALRKRFCGTIILCCDSKSYWRAKEFEWYKGHRKHAKEDGWIDWGALYEGLNEMKVELAENFPYIVLDIHEAEADDIIATLVKYFDENELVTTGLLQTPREIIIGSTDGDFQQLQTFRNVKQWNNVQKKFITCKNPKQYLIEHIVGGDAGDNIPNVCTGDDWARERSNGIPTRAKSFMQSRLQSFYDNGVDACLNESEQNNYRRNQRLVDFSFIPDEISDRIIQAYVNYESVGSRSAIFNYLIEHKMKLLMPSVQDF